MPQHKSAERRVRTIRKRQLRNRISKTRMRNSIRKLRETTDKAQAELLYRDVTKLLDRLAVKRVIHPNNASNKKSKLARFIASLG